MNSTEDMGVSLKEEPVISRVTFNLPKDEFDELKAFALSQGRSVTDTIRRAIGMDIFLSQQERAGKKLLIDDNGKTQVVLRR